MRIRSRFMRMLFMLVARLNKEEMGKSESREVGRSCGGEGGENSSAGFRVDILLLCQSM